MKEIGVSPDAYVVTDGEPKRDRFMGRPVYYLSEVFSDSGIAFVLALTGNAEKVVNKLLRKRNMKSPEGKLAVFSVEFPPMIF